MRIKGKITKNTIDINTTKPVDDHSHCHNSLDGEHKFLLCQQIYFTKPLIFLSLYSVSKKLCDITKCVACGMVLEVKNAK